jgi:hypothetical protein
MDSLNLNKRCGRLTTEGKNKREATSPKLHKLAEIVLLWNCKSSTDSKNNSSYINNRRKKNRVCAESFLHPITDLQSCQSIL